MKKQRSSSEQLDTSWDDNAPAWKSTVREGLIESRRVATDRAIVDAVRDLSPRRVLDVGCGEGWLCRALRQAGIEAVGVDGSTTLIDAARTADPAGVYHVLRYADIGKLHDLVEPGSCDAAVCNFSQPMPWYFRTLESWVETIRDSGFVLRAPAESIHPDTHKPLSLIFTANPSHV